MSDPEITMVETAITPRSRGILLRLKPAGRRARVLRDGEVVADTADALRVIEVGRDLYDPMLHLPMADIGTGPIAATDAAQRTNHLGVVEIRCGSVQLR